MIVLANFEGSVFRGNVSKNINDFFSVPPLKTATNLYQATFLARGYTTSFGENLYANCHSCVTGSFN